eukprot:351111-Chlamydomonas_euryale.AAC.2
MHAICVAPLWKEVARDAGCRKAALLGWRALLPLCFGTRVRLEGLTNWLPQRLPHHHDMPIFRLVVRSDNLPRKTPQNPHAYRLRQEVSILQRHVGALAGGSDRVRRVTHDGNVAGAKVRRVHLGRRAERHVRARACGLCMGLFVWGLAWGLAVRDKALHLG